MVNSGSIVRTLKRVVDVDSYSVITSDDILRMSLADYQQIRRDITIRKRTGAPRYFCQECGHPVYAPKHQSTGPYWRHFRGAPEECPWWTGTPSSTDEVSKRQFHGQQESPLHFKLKHLIAELLALDGKSSSIIVEEKVVGADGYRRPDVQADYSGRLLAFELQLSTTQLPIIIERELFYEKEKRNLVWLTWDFVPCQLAEVRQAFLDIRTSHADNLFTIDAGTIAESRNKDRFVFRVLWWHDDQCRSQLITLDDLKWPDNGLAYAVPIPTPWHTDFKRRWTELPVEWGQRLGPERILWNELIEAINVHDLTENHPETRNVVALVNCLISLEFKRPVASRQSNLAEVANTFLGSEQRYKYSKIFYYAAQRSGNSDLLERKSVAGKMNLAKNADQIEKTSSAAKIARALFPNWTVKK